MLITKNLKGGCLNLNVGFLKIIKLISFESIFYLVVLFILIIKDKEYWLDIVNPREIRGEKLILETFRL